MTNEFQLPGAEKFSHYLEERLGGVLTAEGPKINDGNFYKRWIVRHNGEQLGEYRAYSPKPGETDFIREFHGRIPGYINECRVIANRYSEESERMPEDRVSLEYSNSGTGIKRTARRDAGYIDYKNRDIDDSHKDKGDSKQADRLWQKQDGHDTIPFP